MVEIKAEKKTKPHPHLHFPPRTRLISTSSLSVTQFIQIDDRNCCCPSGTSINPQTVNIAQKLDGLMGHPKMFPNKE